jgi:hypothetical protein
MQTQIVFSNPSSNTALNLCPCFPAVRGAEGLGRATRRDGRAGGVGKPRLAQQEHHRRPVPRAAQVQGDLRGLRTREREIRPVQLPVLAAADGELRSPHSHRFVPDSTPGGPFLPKPRSVGFIWVLFHFVFIYLHPTSTQPLSVV